MIATAVIDEIRKLLAEGRMSQRRIAKKMGVSRGAVAGVANGQRPDYDELRRRREENQEPIPLGPLARCSTCGGMVYLPCRLCQIREQLARLPQRLANGRPAEPLGLDLRGEARARYEAVHLRRMRQGELCEQVEQAPPDNAQDWPDDDEDRQ